VKKCWADDPQKDGFDMDVSIKQVQSDIKKYSPDAVLCGSKGGHYMARLWDLMVGNPPAEADWDCYLVGKRNPELPLRPTQDDAIIPKIPSLVINAHPELRKRGIPKGLKAVVVHGDNDATWKVERGYASNGACRAGSLEAFIRTGSPKLCYLYYTRTQVHLWQYVTRVVLG